MYLDSAFDATWATEVLALVLQMSFGVGAFLDSADEPLFHGAVVFGIAGLHVQEHDAGCANSVWLDLGPSIDVSRADHHS